MCGKSTSGGSTPPPTTSTTTPVMAPPPTTTGGGVLPNSLNDVSFHIYDKAVYPNGQVVTQFHTGYNNVDNLFCTDVMRQQPLTYWQKYGWTATTLVDSGVLRCGDCVRVRNKRNGRETVVFVVDKGGLPGGAAGGFDLDYERVFKVLDQPDNANWYRGRMDIEWAKVTC